MAEQDQVADGVEVAEALRHLLAFDEQKARVKPIAGELLAAERFGLGDFVFVMGKDKVFAAGVQVEAGAELLHRHDRALDVPAGTAGADGGIPRGFAGLGSFPEGEVAGAVFFVFVDVDAGAVGHAGEIFL